MKSNIIIVCLFALTILLNSCKTIEFNTACRYNSIDKDSLYHGIWIDFHKTGKIKSIKSYKHGIENGKWLEYFDNGSIKKKGKYRNGKQIGLWLEYDSYNALISRKRFINGRLISQKMYLRNYW